MSKILIAEDDNEIAMLERDYLEIEGYEVRIVQDGAAAVSESLSGGYDLILLDLMLPGCSGYEVCRLIRDKVDVPILMVTARSESVDKIRGLGLGADDYIPKPFDPAELVARVKSHLRRYQRLPGGRSEEDGAIVIGDLRILPQSWKVFKGGQEIKMPNREFALLKFLAENPNIVFSKERLFETIWGYDYELGTSSAIYKCSSQGEFSAGDLVTLLLGMNGEVVDVIAVSEIQSTYYGVVVSSQKVSSSSSSASSASVQIETQVACTDGSLRTFYTDGTSTYSTGRLVQASVDGDRTSIKTLQTRSLSGTVSSDGTSFAGYDFADNVEILDTDENGGYARIYPSRLAGERLSADDVSYYSLNASGDIERLILSEATGDTLDYVCITSAENQSSGMSVSGAYTYYQDGELHTISTSAVYSVDTGGAALIYEDGELQSMRQLTAVTLTDLGSLTAEAGDQSYDLAEDVVVILRGTGGNGWYESSLSEINDQDYTLRGWYDNLGFSAGRRIRIIVATPE